MASLFLTTNLLAIGAGAWGALGGGASSWLFPSKCVCHFEFSNPADNKILGILESQLARCGPEHLVGQDFGFDISLVIAVFLGGWILGGCCGAWAVLRLASKRSSVGQVAKDLPLGEVVTEHVLEEVEDVRDIGEIARSQLGVVRRRRDGATR